MHIFLTGSSGFIGRHLMKAFIAQGHSITCAVRKLPEVQENNVRYVIADFTDPVSSKDWTRELQNVDVVVNAVGIIREHDAHTFEMLHTQTPIALFQACGREGVGLIVQISALGADEDAVSPYHLSKKAADDYLERSNIPAVILQPSLVYGQGGVSASLFNTLASMPVLVKFGHGRQMIQPIHIDDLVDAVVLSISHFEKSVRKIALVGPSPMTLTEFLMSLRQTMRMRPPPIIESPRLS
jgi:uncharacterized protein YbjT (DUF2867 family)